MKPLLLATTMFVAIATPAFAQQEPAPEASQAGSDGTEIIVTGQKASRTLQDTPTSVGVTTAEDIADRNLTSVYDALAQTANVAVTADKQSFSIRGIDAFNVSGAGDGALASVYLDGAALPMRAVRAGPLELFDIAQVEVYRGPQSTLQGRNSLAGAVIIRTADPAYEWSGRARAQITDADGGRRFAAAIGGPIVDDQLAFRIAGEIGRSDGLNYGATIHDDYDPRQFETIRAKLMATPTALPGLKLIAGFLHDRHAWGGNTYVEFEAPYTPWDRVTLMNTPAHETVKSDIATLDASYEINRHLTLSSVTSYGQVRYDYSYDTDWSASAIGTGHAYEPTDTFSQEVRLNFDFARLQGLIGGYYSNEDGRGSYSEGTQRIVFSTIGLDRQLVAPPPAGFGLPQATANYVMDLYPGRGVQIDSLLVTPKQTRNKALFGDATWEFVDGLKLHAGFRWDHEKQDQALDQTVTLAQPLPDPASVPIAALRPLVAGINQIILGQVSSANNVQPPSTVSYSAFLPKLGLTWQATQDVALSATVQRGYRSGGSGTNTARARYFTYDPEYTWNYELALRTEWFDHRLTLNANLFRIDWSDQQVRVNLTPGNNYDSETVNAGTSRLWGFEVEALGRPTRTLTLNAGVGFTRTKFTSFNVDTGTQIFVATGNEFANAPRWTLNGGATWKAENGLFANINANYRSAAYQDALVQSSREVDARALVNTKLGWQGEHFGAFVFANNLFDARYVQNSFVNGDGRLLGVVGNPRVVGLSFEGRF